jgi:hypothetical protein
MSPQTREGLENMPKPLNQLDRRSFWMWAIPLTAAHLLLMILSVQGFKGLGPLDTVLIFVLAGILARRFRDIGWPVWIGPSFLIVTMLVVPLVAAGYGIASRAPPAQLLQWIGQIGQISGPANLLLLVLAGSVPSRPIAAEAG